MQDPSHQFQKLNDLLAEIQDIKAAEAVLNWDQSTYMPKKGASMRGRQIATLGKLAHEKFVSKDMEELLLSLEGYEDNFSYFSYEASLLRLVKKEFSKAKRLPVDFVNKLLQHQAICYEEWIKAREENNFKRILPYLEKTLDMSKTYAQHFDYEHIADPLIAQSDEGFTTKTIQSIFKDLRQKLLPLLNRVLEQGEVNSSFLNKKYPIVQQEKFNRYLLTNLGYDFNRGRLDVTPHPFMTSFALDDVRMTTRYQENNLTESIFSCIHEMGHAFYELGVDAALDGTYLYGGTSSGVHESQSRLWENIVGRSLEFWSTYYPILQKYFPDNLACVTLEEFYQAIHKVTPGPIRTDADELSYNLHVMIRFDLELAILEGSLKLVDLPQAWNERYFSDLGVVVKEDAQGCLQDVHWFSSFIGGQFQSYTLGNMMSAQFYESALKHCPTLEKDMANGQFHTLRNWLQINLYQHGKKFTGQEVLKMATGQSLSIEPYMRYLEHKFSCRNF